MRQRHVLLSSGTAPSDSAKGQGDAEDRDGKIAHLRFVGPSPTRRVGRAWRSGGDSEPPYNVSRPRGPLEHSGLAIQFAGSRQRARLRFCSGHEPLVGEIRTSRGFPREAAPVATEKSRVTDDDVAEINRATLGRTASVSRHVGTALIVLAAVGVAAWLWVLARQQQLLGGGDGSSGFFGSPEGDVSVTERVDLFASSIGFLLNAAMVAGLGLALRLVAEYLLARSGVSLSGLDVGEPWPDVAEEEDEGDRGVP